MNTIDRVYRNEPQAYDLIANDRDFLGQCLFIKNQWSRGAESARPKVLELFAGPGRHAAAFLSAGAKVALAVDSSPEMKRYARAVLDPVPLYETGVIPTWLQEHDLDYDIVLMLRYAAGYLRPGDLRNVLRLLGDSMTRDSIVAMELHDLKKLRDGLSALAIRERVASQNGLRVVCAWPSNELQWADDAWRVEMPVTFEIFSADTKSTVTGIHSEYIHSIEDVKTACADSSLVLEGVCMNQPPFPDSFLAVLRKIC
jgi:SAM-dependent methyltransferase